MEVRTFRTAQDASHHIDTELAYGSENNNFEQKVFEIHFPYNNYTYWAIETYDASKPVGQKLKIEAFDTKEEAMGIFHCVWDD